ncbi:MAG TPA: ABC transporter ATP-binding protein [Acidimicrobiia bacterium]|jgi:ABC-type multidrug transport system fused ATPase/permease subunit|nr:ABC transporter ATP-binding protein [Acidimicrobiia bacterium]
MPANATKLRSVTYFRDRAAPITWLGLLSLLSGIFQAATLVLVVPLAEVISKGHHHFDQTIGPLHLSLGVEALAIAAALSTVASAALDISIAWGRSVMMSRWEYERRNYLMTEFLSADHETQSRERLGSLATLVTYVTRGTTSLGAIVNGLEAAITILIFLVGALLLNAFAALLLVGMVVVLSVCLRPVMQRTKRYSRAATQVLLSYGQEVTEATRMARDMRVFHARDAIAARLDRISKQLASLRKRSMFVNNLTTPVYQYLGMLIIIGALAAAAGLHGLDITEFGAIALLLIRSMSYGQQLQNSYQTFIDSLPYLETLEANRTTYREHATPDGHVTLEAVHTLDLDGVRFSYDGETEALAGVSVSFAVGEIVGLVGASGSGKSTLSQLLLRLRQPTGGGIFVNRTPAEDYTLASWYRHVSLVPQDPRLLHATVADNISFLDPAITRDQVIAAANLANVHEVIDTLDLGYDTEIGPAFRDLSGGQIQRIGIARALARGAQVLVLDEPTSALDVHSEAVIQSTLETLRSHALVLIIAHRLSTLSICDRVLVLRNGEVETMGSLSEVTERSDFFRRALDAGTLELGGAPTAPQAAPTPADEA